MEIGWRLQVDAYAGRESLERQQHHMQGDIAVAAGPEGGKHGADDATADVLVNHERGGAHVRTTPQTVRTHSDGTEDPAILSSTTAVPAPGPIPSTGQAVRACSLVRSSG